MSKKNDLTERVRFVQGEVAAYRNTLNAAVNQPNEDLRMVIHELLTKAEIDLRQLADKMTIYE